MPRLSLRPRAPRAADAGGADHRVETTRRMLEEVALDLWWTWNEHAQRPFRAIDPARWDAFSHNPIAILRDVPPEVLAARLGEDAMRRAVAEVHRDLMRYRKARTWFDRARRRRAGNLKVAYLCSEFALHESMPQYAGGLGILAGDHLKSASDLGIPLVGVGLLYQHGYYRQQLREDGSTRVLYPRQDPARLPVTDTGARIRCPIGRRSPLVRLWRQRIGRASLILLDADLPENSREERELTEGLYKGEPRLRMEQQVLLGVGGLLALEALGERPTVVHLNEGHAAFAGVWMLSRETRTGAALDAAIDRVRRRLVFTTHTPVPAGHDRYPIEMVATALAPVLGEGGLPSDVLERLGRERPEDPKEPLCMTVLALRLAGRSNGVSRLHGEVSREMWRDAHGVEAAKVPIGSITNGVHVPTWMHPLAAEFWRSRKVSLPAPAPDARPLADAAKADLEGLWDLRNRLRRELVRFVRSRLVLQGCCRGASPDAVAEAGSMLSEDALTIGFARRFATYKRAILLFSDPKRLARILGDARRPVQVVFSGKAHPRDLGGQAFAQKVFEMTQRPEFRGRVVLLEEYDMAIGRALVSGCDVWLNTPLRPHEASGTSGMKSPLNGGINCSISDGWWPEADDGTNGWTIDAGRTCRTQAAQDKADAEALYRLLEEELVPEFHDRGRDGIPRRWLRRAIRSAATVAPVFNTDRMLGEYLDEAYLAVGASEGGRRRS